MTQRAATGAPLRQKEGILRGSAACLTDPIGGTVAVVSTRAAACAATWCGSAGEVHVSSDTLIVLQVGQ